MRKGQKASEELRAKLREAAKNRVYTIEGREKYSISKKKYYSNHKHPRAGIKHSQIAKQKMSNSHIGFKHSDDTKVKISAGHKGEKHWNWKKDRAQLAKSQNRNDSAYKDWRRQVWERDGFLCRLKSCTCKGKIEAHHILTWSEYPNLRYDVNNGITLCHAHHPKVLSEVKRLIPIFQELVRVTKY